MATDDHKLDKDVVIVEAMAKEMAAYLESGTLFMPLPDYADMPNLTVGGYLLRQHRLQVLADLLETGQQSRLQQAIAQFKQARADKPASFNKKAQQELKARLRQWEQYLEEFETGEDSLAYYKTAVEARVIIAELMKALYEHPAEIEFATSERLRKLDERLQKAWQPGNFVWPAAWQPAYPKEDYIWLYGYPDH